MWAVSKDEGSELLKLDVMARLREAKEKESVFERTHYEASEQTSCRKKILSSRMSTLSGRRIAVCDGISNKNGCAEPFERGRTLKRTSPLTDSLYRMPTVLVTGANGFIGSYLIEALVDRGEEVRAFVRYNAFNSWEWLDTVDDDVALDAIEILFWDVQDSNGGRETMLEIDGYPSCRFDFDLCKGAEQGGTRY